MNYKVTIVVGAVVENFVILCIFLNYFLFNIFNLNREFKQELVFRTYLLIYKNIEFTGNSCAERSN